MIVACFGVDVFWVCWFDCLAVVGCCGYGLDSGCCLMIMVVCWFLLVLLIAFGFGLLR